MAFLRQCLLEVRAAAADRNARQALDARATRMPSRHAPRQEGWQMLPGAERGPGCSEAPRHAGTKHC
jgi:hypothetical protein